MAAMVWKANEPLLLRGNSLGRLIIPISLLFCLFCAQVSAGQLRAGGILPSSMHDRLDANLLSSAHLDRQILQHQVADKAGGLFATVSPCPALESILNSTASPRSRMGNFTEAPTSQLLRQCPPSSVLYVFNGNTLAAALREPTPHLKVAQVDASNPIVWPIRAAEYFLPPWTVNVIDCQGQILDLRVRGTSLPIEPVTNVYWRCRAIYPDYENPWTSVEFWIDSEGAFPCNGTSALSNASDYPRSKPAVFPTLTAHFSPVSTVHVANFTLWCYTEADVEELYREATAHSRFLNESPEDSEGLPDWAPWVITAGVAAMFGFLVAALLWSCWQQPCCGRGAQQESTERQADPAMGSAAGSTHRSSVQELASVLSAVLKSERFRSDHAYSTSDSIRVGTDDAPGSLR